MSERSKKILFAVFFIVFSIGMGYALYVLFFVKPPGVTQTPPPGTGIIGNLPNSGAGTSSQQVTSSTGPGTFPTGTNVAPPVAPTGPVTTHLLNDGVTQDVAKGTSDKNGVRFYNPEDGRFYKVNDDGTIVALGDKQFFNVNNVAWGNTTDQVILTFPDGSKVYYDFTQKKQVNLPSHWEDFQFSSSDANITAKSMGVDPSNRFLIVASPQGNDAKAVQALGDNGALVHPSWTPDNQIVAYSETGEPQEDNNQEILFVGQNHENFRGLIAPGQGFLPNWSPTGKQMLFSVWNQDSGGKPDLWITGGQASTIGSNRDNLNIQTWADKCAWSDDKTLYCAVPQGLPINAGLDRTQYTTLPDDLFRVDLTSGTMTKVSTPDQNHPVTSPVVSADKSKFIFTDSATGKLYSYDLH